VSALGEAALSYAELGWRVLPLTERSKAARLKAWQHLASNNPERIRRWWTHRPQSNLGIFCGAKLAVIDIDPDRGHEETFRELCECLDWHPTTPEVHTGGKDGGRHLYFALDAPNFFGTNHIMHPRTGELMPLELKARHQYVAAPPSIHPETGRRYTWHPERTPWTMPLERLPNSLRTLVDQRRARSESGEGSPRPAVSGLAATDDYLKTISPREYVEDLTGVKVPADGFIRCPHPDHDDRTPSFKVYEEARRGWCCYGDQCPARRANGRRAGGSIYDFAALLAGLPVPLPREAAFMRIQDWLLDFYTRKLGAE
jgi:hypothetical protein